MEYEVDLLLQAYSNLIKWRLITPLKDSNISQVSSVESARDSLLEALLEVL